MILGATLGAACANAPAAAPPTITVPSAEPGPTSAPVVTPGPSASSTAPTPSQITDACSGKCTGSGTPELGVALQQRAAGSRRCYNIALTSDATLQGVVQVAIRIGPDGTVCSKKVAASSMPPDMTSCVLQMFDQVTYPPPTGGCIDAVVPMSFKPQTPQAPPASSGP